MFIISPTKLRIELPDYFNDQVMDELELKFYAECFQTSYQSGHSWHVQEAQAVIIPIEHSHELIYTNASEHPLSGSYLMAGLMMVYPKLNLRPFNNNFFGLMSFLHMGGVLRYIHGRQHLIPIKYSKTEASNFMDYCDGL